jgi:hypothetical protein
VQPRIAVPAGIELSSTLIAATVGTRHQKQLQLLAYMKSWLIGARGMSELYRARDPRLNRIVAIKVSEENFAERFEREARGGWRKTWESRWQTGRDLKARTGLDQEGCNKSRGVDLKQLTQRQRSL